MVRSAMSYRLSERRNPKVVDTWRKLSRVQVEGQLLDACPSPCISIRTSEIGAFRLPVERDCRVDESEGRFQENSGTVAFSQPFSGASKSSSVVDELEIAGLQLDAETGPFPAISGSSGVGWTLASPGSGEWSRNSFVLNLIVVPVPGSFKDVTSIFRKLRNVRLLLPVQLQGIQRSL